jgi:3-dehydroquinate dehydratase type I
MIFVSIGKVNFKKALNIVKKHKFIELRLDLLNFTIKEYQKLISLSKKTILTYKKGESDEKRLNTIKKLLLKKVAYVDIDIKEKKEFIEKLLLTIANKKTIFSYHNKKYTPLKKDLNKIVKTCEMYGANFIKLVTLIKDKKDFNRINSLKNKKILKIGLGKKGLELRKKSKITYVAFNKKLRVEKNQTTLEELKSKTKLLCVSGTPIIKSLSPNIWNFLFKTYDIDAFYFKYACKSKKDLNFLRKTIKPHAVNLTSPLKQLLGKDPVNCIKGKKTYNTDSLGLLKAFKKESIDLKNKKVLILGFGGASKAILSIFNKSKVYIYNRTSSKLSSFKNITKVRENELRNISKEMDIIINNIPKKDLKIYKNIILNKKQIFLEGDYKTYSKLYLKAKKKGLKIINSKLWLYFQAIEFFKILFNINPKKKNLSLKPYKIKTSISLIGPMGVGKTTIAKALAKKLTCPFIDLDNEVEKLEGKKINEIFKLKGETYFRKLETKVLKNINFNKKQVLATGGGLLNNEVNKKLLLKTNRILLLNTSSVCKKRLKNFKRPLEKNFSKLFEERKLNYLKNSDILIYNDKVKETVKLILDNLKC